MNLLEYLTLIFLVLSQNAKGDCEDESCKEIPSNHTLMCSYANCGSIPKTQPGRLLKFIDFSHNKITEITQVLHYQVAISIDLSFNNIKNIENGVFFNCLHLQTLHLAHNNLTFLTPGVFNGLNNVRYLFLQSNYLQSLQSSQFNLEFLTNLRTLDLSFNKIYTIHETSFSGLGLLTTLHIHHNKITGEYFNNVCFKDLTSLKTLDASNNYIEFIGSGSINKSANLVSLNLSQNSINSMASDVFFGMDSLAYLRLDWNLISHLEPGTFNLKSLEELDLSFNHFNDIKPEYFQNCTARKLILQNITSLKALRSNSFSSYARLERLHISKNHKLSEIEAGAFGGGVALRDIYLDTNALETLKQDTLDFASAENVDLSQNPWRCDKDIAWMASEHIKWINKHNMRCASPAHLKGMQISKLNPGDFDPPTIEGRRIAIGVLICSAILIFAIVLAVLWRYRDRILSHQSTTRYRSLYDVNEDDVTFRHSRESRPLPL